MERVLILAGDAVEDLEIYFILYRLREAGYAVDVAAPSRKTIYTVVHDFEPDWDTYVERPGRRLEPDLAFSEVDPERYVGGGRSGRSGAGVLRGARLPQGQEELRLSTARSRHRGGRRGVRRRPRRRGREHDLLPRLDRSRRVVEGLRRRARARGRPRMNGSRVSRAPLAKEASPRSEGST